MLEDDAVARKGIGPLAMKSFFRLCTQWRLTRTEAMTLLGITSTSTYANWKNGKCNNIPRDTLERISYMIDIEHKVQFLTETVEDEGVWLRYGKIAPHFEEATALQQMLKGNVSDLYMTSHYLTELSEICCDESMM